MSKETIRVPDVGSSDPVDVIEVSVKKGDTVEAEDTIVVLESDKASLEVPCPKAGTVLELKVKAGDQVKEGDPLLDLDVAGDDAGEADIAAPTEESGADEQAGRSDFSRENDEAESGTADDAAADNDDAKKAPASKGGTRTVAAPDLGDIDAAEIIEINVAEGDSVEAEQTILVIESDKASLEVPSPEAGTVKKLLVKVGDKIGTGSDLMELETAGGSGEQASDKGASRKPASEKQSSEKSAAKEDRDAKAARSRKSDLDEKPSEAGRQSVAPETPERVEGKPSASVHAGPAVRKLARETGIDLADVTPSGPKERILKEDVHALIKQRLENPPAAGGAGMPDLPEIDFSEFGPVERQELNKLRKVAAKNLHRSWITIPHVTQFDEADITELEAFRKSQNKALEKEGVKLTMLAFLVKACANALREFPRFNSSLELGGEALIMKDYVHIGIAVDTPNGLVVPVIRDADKKGLKDIALEMGELAGKARDRKLSPADMKGATFSISSLGGIGGTAFTPIVNWPEVAILGVSRSDTKPVWDGKTFQPRLTLPLSLSYDHRVIDGADAARFTSYLSQLLSDMRRALL
ncbi:dihydrolipoyllysine-residue acetyltransferase [Alloalcanivorax marinus]|uniref:dihydrolipoyllysine-residue acetyltransferase n=1 Tax=Alloalcanivorax marinus TaxID=1177169 RepID=UPI001933190E|nr:dihydrolipoyllysine-residue acetyltransferase [Alloalcanivorax marinus]